MLVPSDRPFLRYMLVNQPMGCRRQGNSSPQPDPTYDKSSIPEDRQRGEIYTSYCHGHAHIQFVENNAHYCFSRSMFEIPSNSINRTMILIILTCILDLLQNIKIYALKWVQSLDWWCVCVCVCKKNSDPKRLRNSKGTQFTLFPRWPEEVPAYLTDR